MKRFIILNGILLILTFLGISCSNSINFSGDEEKVKNITIQSHSYPPGTMNITEIKLVRTITAEDSINYYLKGSDDIVLAHDETLQKLNSWLELKESKTYSEWDIDAQIKNLTDELNRFANAFDGLTDESWSYAYTYKRLYELRQMDKDKALVKIYSITYTLNTSKPIKEIRSFDAGITRSLATYSDIEAVKKPVQGDLERIHFKHYDGTSKEEEIPEATFIQEGGEIQEFDDEGNPIK